jgi:hypothetical protein
VAATLVVAGRIPARAYPPSPTAPPKAPATATPHPAGNVLPFDSDLVFVTDDSISSKSSKTGQLIGTRLKDPLIVGGRVVAPAGTPAKLRIVDVSAADIGDVYGFVDIFFEPLQLPDGRTIPLRAPIARLEPRNTAGHESTVELEDTVADQVIPYHFLYHIFRKGKNFVLGPGSQIPARTEATLTALPNGTVAIQTPAPMHVELQMPKSSFPAQPFATPFASGPSPSHRAPRPQASPTGTPWPTPEPPTATPSPSPNSSPAALPSATPSASP